MEYLKKMRFVIMDTGFEMDGDVEKIVLEKLLVGHAMKPDK